MAEVQCVGALNWDRVLSAERFAPRGDEARIESIEESVGGSGANTASWLAPHRDVEFNGYVGTDAEGDRILDALESAGVDTAGVESVEGRTGQAFVVSEGGERTIYVQDGVNDAKHPAGDADLVHTASFFRPGALETQAEVVREADAYVAFSPGFLCRRRPEELKPVLLYTDVLLVNEEEADALGDLADIPPILATTLGPEGCRVRRGDDSVTVPPEDVEPVDVTGAGDAFAAGFIDAYLDDADIEEMGRRGNEFAARCVETPCGFRAD